MNLEEFEMAVVKISDRFSQSAMLYNVITDIHNSLFN